MVASIQSMPGSSQVVLLGLQVWVVEDGHITNYNGYFEDYRDELHKEIAAELDEEERVAAERAAERAAAKAAKGGKK